MIVFPNAKINIGLFVTEKRKDGFHNLETLFYPIGLSDRLDVEVLQGERDGVCVYEGSGIAVDCAAEKNLVVKAYQLLAKDFCLPAVQVHLHKVIPFGAGLGGGSSDAAFMLKALNDCLELRLPAERLTEYAARLGSDCAFFIYNTPVFAHGKGELMEKTDLSLDAYQLLLVKPESGVSTSEAYKGICPGPASFDLRKLERLPVEEWKENVKNDFEESVFRAHPEIANIKDKLYQQGAVYASMTGSGSAVFGLFKRDEAVPSDYPGCFTWQG